MANPVEGPSPAGSSAGSMKSGIEDELEGAQKAFDETSADLTEKAGELASDATSAMAEKAEGVKHGLSGGLAALGGALRAAGDHLSENDQEGSSKLVSEAASGLERLAESVENKPLGQVFEELRTFGRNNAGGLFAGSMLAGFALARLLKAADGESTAGGKSAGGPGREFSKASDTNDAGKSSADTTSPPPPSASSGYAL